jgi:alkylhydroperoxidase family enzyme
LSRIPYPDMDNLSPVKQAAVDRLGRRPLNVTCMGFHAPDAFWKAHYEFKNACVYATTLDPVLREVLILRVAYLSKSDYEIHHHLSISANLGFPPEKQADIAAGRYDRLTPAERAVAQFTDEVVVDGNASDATLAAIKQHFDAPLIIEMLILIGSYMGTARIVAVTGIEPDAQAVQGWTKDPEA